MDPAGQFARRFPLVARTRPPCVPLARRVAELCDRARHVERTVDDAPARRIAAGVIERAVAIRDGYTARDVLAHGGCRELLSDHQTRTLTELVEACELGTGTLPSTIMRDLTGALTRAEEVIVDNLSSIAAMGLAMAVPPPAHSG